MFDTEENSNTLPDYIGHRKRTKDKFLTGEPSTFLDYELIELLLFYAVPRKDVKPLAKSLIKVFSCTNQLLNATSENILGIKDANQNIYLLIRLVREFTRRSLVAQISKKNIISSWSALLDYLKFHMSELKIEEFRVLFLNKKNFLIADEIIATGTVDQIAIYPREIIKRALNHAASAIILVHNHPSGEIAPSKADIQLTQQIMKACKSVNVVLHDHLIIGGLECYSFRTNMLLDSEV